MTGRASGWLRDLKLGRGDARLDQIHFIYLFATKEDYSTGKISIQDVHERFNIIKNTLA